MRLQQGLGWHAAVQSKCTAAASSSLAQGCPNAQATLAAILCATAGDIPCMQASSMRCRMLQHDAVPVQAILASLSRLCFDCSGFGPIMVAFWWQCAVLRCKDRPSASLLSSGLLAGTELAQSAKPPQASVSSSLSMASERMPCQVSHPAICMLDRTLSAHSSFDFRC